MAGMKKGRKSPLPSNVRPGTEKEGHAHPDDRIDRLGRVFCAMGLHEKHSITFERFVEAVDRGTWHEYMNGGCRYA